MEPVNNIGTSLLAMQMPRRLKGSLVGRLKEVLKRCAGMLGGLRRRISRTRTSRTI